MSRPLLIALLAAHILLVWGASGLLGEGWIMQPFCAASKIGVISLFFLVMWLASTLSPIVGLASLKFSKFLPWYFGLVALTMFTLWFGDFMREIRVFYCDAL